ncbi:MAG: CinA family protein [Alphaproteobacteria bacterium]|nr:CinA family protein [Alphaproteobacteria bacterium]
MRDILPIAELAAAGLRARGETIAIAESSAGGLISSALLALPGASAYFLGGAVIYTAQARAALMNLHPEDLLAMRPSTESYAMLLARRVRERHGATWGLGETGAAGPADNRYGDAAGHACIAIAGPYEFSLTLETGSGDRQANMRAFAARALEALIEALRKNV